MMKGGDGALNWSAIGKKIKDRRKQCKITQIELAEKIGKTESSIRKYEKGLVSIPTDVLEKIAEVMETTPFALFGSEWFDMKIGPEAVDAIQKEVSAIEGMVAILSDLYGSVEVKEVSSAEWEQPYYVIGTPPNSFILHEGNIETLINTTKAFLPAIVEQLKETRPEELVIQEIRQELENLQIPKE